jgi:hypothetical protein
MHKYHSARYSEPLVMLPRSGLVYMKSDKSSTGCYMIKYSKQIHAMLNAMTPERGYFLFAEEPGVRVLTIVDGRGTCLSVQQLDITEKRLWTALLKIQAWLRGICKTRRLVTVAMCLHERLGEAAELGRIGADNIELIARHMRI